METKQISALILAAGLSERMGFEKLMLTFPDGATFIEHIIRQYHKFGCERIIVVLNPKGKELYSSFKLNLSANPEILVNHHPEKGRNHSLRMGLSSLINENAVFVHNVDNPIVSQEVLNALMTDLNDADYSKPIYLGKGGHPLLIKKTGIHLLLKESGSGDPVFKILQRNLVGKHTEVNEPGILLNINTLEEYQDFIKSCFA